MTPQTPFKRLILRAVLRNVSPMVIRVVSLPDSLDLPDFDEVFRAILGWDGQGFIFSVHGRSSIVFAAERSPRRCVISNFGRRKHFSTPAVPSTCGNGSAGF